MVTFNQLSDLKAGSLLCVKNKMKWIKISILSSLSFSAIFSAVSLLFYFGDWERLFFVAIFGIFVGLLAAPEFDKKEFSYPCLFQVINGAISGLIVGNHFSSNTETIILSVIFGGILGWSAPFWLKHIQIP